MQVHSFRPLRRLVLGLILLGLILPSAGFADRSDAQMVLDPGTTEIRIPISVQAIVLSIVEPLHGTLIPVIGGYDYLPQASFWEVGHDMVTFEVSTRNSIVTSRISLVAGTVDDSTAFHFGEPPPGGYSQPWIVVHPEDVDIRTGWVGDISYGMNVEPNHPDPPRVETPPHPSGHEQDSEHEIYVRVEDISDHNWDPSNPTADQSFYRILQGTNTLVELVANFDTGLSSWMIRPKAPGLDDFTPAAVDEGFYHVRMVRWINPGGSGADLYINRRYVGTLRGLPMMSTEPETYEMNLAPTPENAGLVMRFEAPTVAAGLGIVGGQTRETLETFSDLNDPSSLDVDVWDHVEGDSHMAIAPQDLPGIGQQLEIDLGSVPHWEHAYMIKEFLADPLNEFRSRFWMDPSLVNIPEGHHLRVIYGCTVAASNYCVDFRLLLVRENGNLELRLYTWDDIGGSQIISTVLTEAPHFIEMQFRTSDAANVSTGWAQLWVDSESVGISDNLRNFNKKVEDVRYGSNYTSSTITGILKLDEIEIWTP